MTMVIVRRSSGSPPCVIHVGHELVGLLGGTIEGQEKRGHYFAHRAISSSRGQGHTHRDSAHFGNSSLAVEEVDGADHPNAPSRSAMKPSTETLIE